MSLVHYLQACHTHQLLAISEQRTLLHLYLFHFRTFGYSASPWSAYDTNEPPLRDTQTRLFCFLGTDWRYLGFFSFCERICDVHLNWKMYLREQNTSASPRRCTIFSRFIPSLIHITSRPKQTTNAIDNFVYTVSSEFHTWYILIGKYLEAAQIWETLY